MEIGEKLRRLADSAKYDVSCASSGHSRKGKGGAVGSASASGICHSWSADGRCISLLKVLYSNHCIYDCSYCINRSSRGGRRVSFTSDELVELCVDFYRRNYIEGLFLSSAVFADPDTVMERLIQVVMKLRKEHGFGGYIHLKAIPGASPELLALGGRWSDRMSVNIELPSQRSLERLAPDKKRDAILSPMHYLSGKIQDYREACCEQRRSLLSRHAPPPFAPAGQSTQLIVGASPESDRTILKLSNSLYKRFQMKRVYYSAFVPVHIPEKERSPEAGAVIKLREHRLYQADWLIRFYQFDYRELLDGDNEQLDSDLDPKSAWALAHPEFFPVNIQEAEFSQLLRVPGIGPLSARKIIALRRECRLLPDYLSRLGVVMKRAQYFVICGDRSPVSKRPGPERLRRCISASGGRIGDEIRAGQLMLFGPEAGLG